MNDYICELSRRLVHPETGIELPHLTTFQEWIDFIHDRPSWVNAGIDEKTAEIFSQLPFGQVITNTCSDFSLFRYGQLGNIIQKFLCTPGESVDQRIVMNYVSFEKLVSLIYKEISPADQGDFNQNFLRWKASVNTRTFWIHFLVSHNRLQWLQRNQVGVIVTTHGDQSFYRLYPDGSNIFNRNDGLFHRILLNGRDLQDLFTMAYVIQNPQKNDRKNENFFELLGGYDKDLLVDFMKLSL